MKGPDQLRQRVAFALSQILVVSAVKNTQFQQMSPYLKLISDSAFGSYRDLMMAITLHPSMGYFLDMVNNDKANPATGSVANENYAREIMQLFSIGVDTLNQDGTPVLDAQGNRVASYDQNTITNLARVFTGWDLDVNKTSPFDGTSTALNYQDPMVPNANRNRVDIGQKTLLVDIRGPNPVVVPACANCTNNTLNTQNYVRTSLDLAIDNLFYHPNTGPFVCVQMIHQLVTSNPSPAYVGRCAAAFANNGSGLRGDMKAVITSILLDPEARGDLKTDPNYGHLREPVLLMTHLLRAFNATDASKTDGVLVSNSPQNFSNALGQNVFNPPTVFSYFPADFNLPGTNLFGPEYGILDTSSSYARSNFINTLFLTNGGNGIPVSAPNRPQGTQISFASFQAQSTTPQQLVDALNARLMHGTMSAQMNASMVATVTAITNANATTQALQRTQTAIYLVATSSQYQVER